MDSTPFSGDDGDPRKPEHKLIDDLLVALNAATPNDRLAIIGLLFTGTGYFPNHQYREPWIDVYKGGCATISPMVPSQKFSDCLKNGIMTINEARGVSDAVD